MSISPRVEQGGSKYSHLRRIIMYKNRKVDLVWGSILPKIRVASKKVLNKSYSKLNFIQKSPRTHISISPQSGARGPKRFPSLQNNTFGEPFLTLRSGSIVTNEAQPRCDYCQLKTFTEVGLDTPNSISGGGTQDGRNQ